MVNRSSAKGKKRKVEQEEWSPSKSHCLRGQQIVRARGRPNYSEASNSDDDCLMIDEESSSTQPEGVASSPGTLSDADIRLAIQIALLYQSQSSKIFKSFPIEIHQAIAHYLPTDLHVVIYKQICIASYNAIGDSFWRKRFSLMFDPIDEIEGKTPDSEKLAAIYKHRRQYKGKRICFDFRHAEYRLIPTFREWQIDNQPIVLQVLKDMILESNAHLERDEKNYKITVGRNQDYIRDWVYEHRDGQAYLDIVDSVMKTAVGFDPASRVSASTEGSMVMVIQLSLASLVLDYNVLGDYLSFHQSQVDAYADDVTQPIFVGKWKQDVNVKWCLSTLNFFSFHLNTEGGEGVLCQEYWELKKDQIAQPWTGRLKEGTQTLGTKWKGAYTFLNAKDLHDFRTLDEERQVDEFEPLQDIALFFNEAQFSSAAWPRSFEQLIETNPYHNRDDTPTRNSKRNAVSQDTTPPARQYEFKSFHGSNFGPSAETITTHYYGRLHGLPPQRGIPGFQRISFLRFQEEDVDHEQIWGYEGCVCPGGNVIVGRWWHITPGVQVEPIDQYSGPFIFWNVDGNHADVAVNEEAGMEFLNNLREEGFGY